MRKMKVSELVLDFDLYPRASIDTHHAAEMSHAVAAGSVLPPIVIDKKSKRIVDGFHRQRVYSRLFGEDYEVDVVEKSYKNDGELFLDAIRYNAAHGLRMDTSDKTKCILRAKELHVDADMLATALHIDPKRIGELTTTRTASSGGLAVVLKRTNQHMAGRKLTKAQVQANENSSGMHQVFYVNQLIDLIESGLLNTSDEKMMTRLQKLGELIAGVAAVA